VIVLRHLHDDTVGCVLTFYLKKYNLMIVILMFCHPKCFHKIICAKCVIKCEKCFCKL
jgi:hypothetical protein